MVDLHFLILAVTEPIFNTTAKLIMPIETPADEAKAETETHPLTKETKMRKCFAFHSLNHCFVSLFHLYFLV